MRSPFVLVSWTQQPEARDLLGYDPCGMGCEIMRSCYTRQCQFYTGGGRPSVIRWYRAPPGAKCLPFPSSIMSWNWSPKPYPPNPIGEINTAPATWSNGRTPPTARGQHWFGPPEWFEFGQPWNPSGPEYPRDPFGLAVACTGMPAPELGVVDGSLSISAEGDNP